GSLKAVLKNDIPRGTPNDIPDGTLMMGLPTMAAGEELPITKWSPLIKSVGQAGLSVGATIASRLLSARSISMPSVAPMSWSWASASLYEKPKACVTVGSVLNDSANRKISWPKNGISLEALLLLKSIA